MLSIESCTLPDHALLREYTRRGAYTDCFRTDVPGRIEHAQFVTAFYTTPLFRLERIILKWVFSKPSSDLDAERLAAGEADLFAAWSVEGRDETQLLLSDFKGRTRSWLMVAPQHRDAGKGTRLYFGSAVVPRRSPAGEAEFGRGFSMLIGFHRLYSVLLLHYARLRLMRGSK